MSTIFDFPLEEIIKRRVSVRNYSAQPLEKETKDKINDYIGKLSNPFAAKVTCKLFETKTAPNAAKLGTYGVVKGATEYIGATVKKEEFALEALGYEFEKLVLYVTSLGLSTCWLGGTFKKREFAKVISVKEDELFPVISPLGFAFDKKGFADTFIKFIAHSHSRKQWDELFFNKDFATPLSSSDAGVYNDSLEMLRLAPSALNKQPWRILKDGNNCHFYQLKKFGYSIALGYDIQRIDMGIAACHFHLAAIEKNLNGKFEKLPAPVVDVPKGISYIFSWVSEKRG